MWKQYKILGDYINREKSFMRLQLKLQMQLQTQNIQIYDSLDILFKFSGITHNKGWIMINAKLNKSIVTIVKFQNIQVYSQENEKYCNINQISMLDDTDRKSNIKTFYKKIIHKSRQQKNVQLHLRSLKNINTEKINDIKIQKKQIEQLKTQLQKLTKCNTQNNEKIKDLQYKLKTIPIQGKRQRIKLQLSMDTLQEQNVKLKISYNRLQSEYKQLQAEMKQLTLKQTFLNNKIQYLQHGIITGFNRQIVRQNEMLQMQNRRLLQKVKNLQNDIRLWQAGGPNRNFNTR